MRLTKRLFLWKIITIVIGALGVLSGMYVLFLSAFAIPFDFNTYEVNYDEALLNSIANGSLILIPSLIFMVCSIWFGMGIKWSLWSLWGNPLIASIIFVICGLSIYLLKPQIANIGLAIMAGGLLGVGISYVFIQLDKE